MKVNEKKTVLVISGLDPSGHAGIVVDIETVVNLKHHPCAIVSTSTIQNNEKVTGAYVIDDVIFNEQLQIVIENNSIHAVKIGLLISRKTAQIIVSCVEKMNIPVVYDPVYQASSGYYFTDKDTFLSIAEELSKVTRLITPNRLEAETLGNMTIGNESHFAEAAARITYKNILIKGGHFEKKNRDFLYREGQSEWIEGSNNPLLISRGTGCRLSTAIACFLADNQPLDQSIIKAKDYLEVRFSSRA